MKKKRFPWKKFPGARVLLYETLVEKFGPRKDWTTDSYPTNAEEFEEFLKDFAEGLEKSTGEGCDIKGIGLQIKHGSTIQKGYATKNGNARALICSWIKNRKVALQTGFIGIEDLPEITIFTEVIDGKNKDRTIRGKENLYFYIMDIGKCLENRSILCCHLPIEVEFNFAQKSKNKRYYNRV